MTSWRAESSVSTQRSEGSRPPLPTCKSCPPIRGASLGDIRALALLRARSASPRPASPLGPVTRAGRVGDGAASRRRTATLSFLGLVQHHKLSSRPRAKPASRIHSSARASRTTVRARPCHGPRIKSGVTTVGAATASPPPLMPPPAPRRRRARGRQRRPGPAGGLCARPCRHPGSVASRPARAARRADRPPSKGGRPRRSAR